MTTTATVTDAGSQLGPAIREAVVRTMAQVCEQTPKITEKPAEAAGEGVSAMIDYKGDANFTLVLALPRATVAPLTKMFTGVPINWEADILDDVVGELLNVIGGDVVAELSVRGIEVQMGLPRVARCLEPGVALPASTVLDGFGVTGSLGSYIVRVVSAPGDAG